jgi:hypothetical protein
MRHRCILRLFGAIGLLAVPALLPAQPVPAHPECAFFGPERNRFLEAGRPGTNHQLSSLTEDAVRRAGYSVSSRGPEASPSYAADSIDAYIFADLDANGIKPAPLTTDWEFIRRVTLDLTGRIPAPERVLTFVADTSSGKRAKLIDELLAASGWLDKWTMYFGDFFKNSAYKASTGASRYPDNRDAFFLWLKDSLARNKPYDQIAKELISPPLGNSYQTPNLNWLAGGVVLNAPAQDITDQMTANVFDTFMGVAHVNCLLCHDGRGHLESQSLWGSNATRYQGWQLASFLSRTSVKQMSSMAWFVQENASGYSTDYRLNTVTGNRPPRHPRAGCDPGAICENVAPNYIFNGDTPKPGENYRDALARNITGDFQFARATVNYLWAEFFGRGIVDPPNLFDPARLDPESPPPDPWKLQPSNPALLNALARHFIASGYNLKAAMREIATSATYQLSSRYEGEWNREWEPYFARKYVRRLWAEELHDAIIQSSGSSPYYVAPQLTQDYSFAMRFPEPFKYPSNDAATRIFLDAFMRGNRDDQPRKRDGSIAQALSLMNSPFIESHLQIDGPVANQLIKSNLAKDNQDLIRTLFLAILSRYPSQAEMATATPLVDSAGTDRLAGVQDLVWLLYNKVDFIFNF